MSLLEGIYADTPLDNKELTRAALNVANKRRSNPLPWRGQFTPELVELLLERYAAPGAVVLDPFVGSGTLLWEAGRAGLSAFGCEINPAAAIMARLYTLMNMASHDRELALGRVTELLDDEFPCLALRSPREASSQAAETKGRLVTLTLDADSGADRRLLEALVVLVDFHSGDVTSNKVISTWRKVASLVRSLPECERPIWVFHADARRIPLSDRCVDLVITSPPYINVLNYHQEYRASTEALGWNLLAVARSEFGANRKYRGNRFLTVIQFCLDMGATFCELRRVCDAEGRVVLVVGRESNVRGTPFMNGEIVAEVAHRVGDFQLLLRQERDFTNRYGTRIVEDILHFGIRGRAAHRVQPQEARLVARDALLASLPLAPAQAKRDLQSAVANLHSVQPSPLFRESVARAAHFGEPDKRG